MKLIQHYRAKIRSRRNRPRVVGLAGFRSILYRDLYYLGYRRQCLEQPRARSPRAQAALCQLDMLIFWHRDALSAATTAEKAAEIYLEWQIERPEWLGRRGRNIIYDPHHDES